MRYHHLCGNSVIVDSLHIGKRAGHQIEAARQLANHGWPLEPNPFLLTPQGYIRNAPTRVRWCPITFVRDLRAVSQLNILNELMRRVEYDQQADSRILPCDYFHMMAGVGTGGIIAFLLGILGMGIEDTITEFAEIWHSVYADSTPDRTKRTERLENVIKGLLKRKGFSETRKMYVEDAIESPCKVFFCASPESDVNICEKFRNYYQPNKTSSNPTVVEAIRATCAIPKLFPSVSIEAIGCRISYVSGALNFNNPTWQLIVEACEHFGRYRRVEFLVSLGAGQRALVRAPSNHDMIDSSDLIAKIASNRDQVSSELEWRIGKLNTYYRLCVDRALEYDNSQNPVGDITAWTHGYLEKPSVTAHIDMCIGISRHAGEVKLEQIAGLSEKSPTGDNLSPIQQDLIAITPQNHLAFIQYLAEKEGLGHILNSDLGESSIAGRLQSPNSEPNTPISPDQAAVGFSERHLPVGRETEVASLVKGLLAKPRTSAIILGDTGESKSAVASQVLRNQKVISRFKVRRYFVSCAVTSTAAELLGVIGAVLRPTNLLPVSEQALLKFLASGPAFLVLDALENAWGNDPDAVEDFLQKISNCTTILGTICGDAPPGRVHWDLQLPIRPTSPRPASNKTRKFSFKLDHEPSDFFTGCDELLASIHAIFRHWEAISLPPGLTHAQTITGLGGIGKTRAAVEYAHRFKDEYAVVHWIVADTEGALEAGYVSLAHALQLKEAKRDVQKDIVAAVLKWLSENTRWLLILDNVDNLDLLNGKLPQPMGGHLLVTTRQEQADSFFRDARMPCMDADTGALFLLRRSAIITAEATLTSATPEDIAVASALVTDMGGLPLAIDQAGGYIASQCIGLAEYQTLYHQSREEMLRDRGGARDQSSKLHVQPVFTTFSLSFQNIMKTNLNVANLLNFCAFIHPDAIPKAMLVAGATHLDTGLQKILKTSSELSNAIQLLRHHSLISLNSSREIMTIHRLVQEILRFSMSPSTRLELATSAVKVVDTVFPFVNYGTLPSARLYSPHAEVCAENVDNYSLAFPQAAHLLYYLGAYFYYLGQYSRAESSYEASLGVLHNIKLTEDDPQRDTIQKLTATVIRALAQSYWRVGRYKESNPLWEQALRITEEVSGPNDRETALTLHLFARVLGEQGIYERCNSLFERALFIWDNSKEADQEKMYARSEHEFARLLGIQGFHKRAEALSSHALTVFEKPDVAGPTHPTTASILRALIHIRMDQGRYDQAEKNLGTVLRIMEEQLGRNHIEVGTTCHELGLVQHKEKRYKEAESYYLRALDIYKSALQEYKKKHPSPGHPDTVATLSALANLYQTLGRNDEAMEAHERALAICADQLTPQHIGAISIYKNYSTLSQQTGKDDEDVDELG